MEKGNLQHGLQIDAFIFRNRNIGVIMIEFMQHGAIHQSEAFAIML